MSSLDELPYLDIDAPDFTADPVQALREALATSELHRSRRGIEVLGHEAQWSLLRDRRLSQDQAQRARDAGITDPDVWRFRTEFMISQKGDVHARLRSTVARFFGRPHTESLRPTIRGFINTLLDEVGPVDRVDLLEEVCLLLPAMTYAHLVRAPLSDAPFIARMSESILRLAERDPEVRRVVEGAYHELFDYTEARFDAIAADPGDDLISHLLATVEAGKLSRREAMDLAVLLLEASADNSTHEMALVLGMLLEDRARFEAVQADPSLVVPAVEEAIRLRPQVLANERVAFEELDWREHGVPVGTRFALPTIAANRDPQAYAEPDVFDMHRVRPPASTMFGGGMTACLGANLARVEIQEFVLAVIERYPDIRLDGPAGYTMKEFETESLGLHVVLG